MVIAQDYTQLKKGELYLSFALVSSLFFLWGLSYGLLDVLNQHFYHIFELSHVQTTLLQFAYFVAYLVVSPFHGMFMRRFGYKLGIHLGLGLFSFGAIMFWPSAKYEKYGMFVAFTFIAASGITALEVAANTYMIVLGPAKHAAFRLTFAQSFNGIATVIGPLIASNTFFNGANANSLGWVFEGPAQPCLLVGLLGSLSCATFQAYGPSTVQYVYLALALFAVLLNVGFALVRLPEVRQHVTIEEEEAMERAGFRGFLKQHHTIWGVYANLPSYESKFVAEWFYTGAQVAVASTAIFYLTQEDKHPHWSSADASNIFAGCQAAFTIGRFFGVGHLRYIDPAFVLFVHGVMLVLFAILTSTVQGYGGVVCLFFIFFFESVCYPVIYSIATSNLGGYAKLGGALVCMGVSGGAAYPSAQNALVDSHDAHISYLVPMTGFVPLMIYGCVMWILKCRRMGKMSILVRDLDGKVEHQIDETLGVEPHPRDDREYSVGEKADVAHTDQADYVQKI